MFFFYVKHLQPQKQKITITRHISISYAGVIYLFMYIYIYIIYIQIAQLVRASERNSVVVGSNPTQANFL